MQTRLKVQANISSQPFPIVTADPLIVELCSALMQHRVQIPVHSWQTSPDVEPVRAKMRDQVLHIITQGKAMQSRQASEGLRNVSNAVETGLFGAASTLEEYMDENTLSERVRDLVKRLLPSLPVPRPDSDGAQPLDSGREDGGATLHQDEVKALSPAPASRLFIIKVLDGMLAMIQERKISVRQFFHLSVAEIQHLLRRVHNLLACLFPDATSLEASSAEIVKRAEKLRGEMELYGGVGVGVSGLGGGVGENSQLDDDKEPCTGDVSSSLAVAGWTEARDLLVWWKCNILSAERFSMLVRESAYRGQNRKRTQRANFYRAILLRVEAMRAVSEAADQEEPPQTVGIAVPGHSTPNSTSQPSQPASVPSNPQTPLPTLSSYPTYPPYPPLPPNPLFLLAPMLSLLQMHAMAAAFAPHFALNPLYPPHHTSAFSGDMGQMNNYAGNMGLGHAQSNAHGVEGLGYTAGGYPSQFVPPHHYPPPPKKKRVAVWDDGDGEGGTSDELEDADEDPEHAQQSRKGNNTNINSGRKAKSRKRLAEENIYTKSYLNFRRERRPLESDGTDGQQGTNASATYYPPPPRKPSRGEGVGSRVRSGIAAPAAAVVAVRGEEGLGGILVHSSRVGNDYQAAIPTLIPPPSIPTPASSKRGRGRPRKAQEDPVPTVHEEFLLSAEDVQAAEVQWVVTAALRGDLVLAQDPDGLAYKICAVIGAQQASRESDRREDVAIVDVYDGFDEYSVPITSLRPLRGLGFQGAVIGSQERRSWSLNEVRKFLAGVRKYGEDMYRIWEEGGDGGGVGWIDRKVEDLVDFFYRIYTPYLKSGGVKKGIRVIKRGEREREGDSDEGEDGEGEGEEGAEGPGEGESADSEEVDAAERDNENTNDNSEEDDDDSIQSMQIIPEPPAPAAEKRQVEQEEQAEVGRGRVRSRKRN